MDCKQSEEKSTRDSKLGLRYNEGKQPLSLLLEANNAVQGLSGVLAYGAKKYARGNYLRGLPHTQIVDSLLRHLTSYMSGEDVDPESKLRHVDHVLANAFFLSELTARHPQLDDRSPEVIDE